MLHHTAWAQRSNIGTPFITNYYNNAYRGGAQNYAIVQDGRGVLYFANEKGMLEFDGYRWRCTPVANKTKVRSLLFAGGRIYAGAQGDLGYFTPDARGFWSYHSLVSKLPAAHRDFADVWDIVQVGNDIFFRSSAKLFRFSNQQFEVIAEGGSIFYDFLAQVGTEIVVNEAGLGLCRLVGKKLTPLPGGNQLSQKRITAVLPQSNGTHLIATLKDGFYVLSGGEVKPWRTSYDAFLRRHWINDAITLPDGRLAIGSHDNGVLIADANGNPIHHLNKLNGLQNNTVVTLQLDRAQNIWVGLNNGIDFIAYNEAFSCIYPDRANIGTGFASLISGGKLYLALNNGVYCRDWQQYYSPFQAGGYQPVAGMLGQAWSLMEVKNSLFLGHHEGTFLVQGAQARQVSPVQGAWLVMPLAGRDDALLCGTYTGLIILRKTASGWQQGSLLPGFAESSRIIAQDKDGALWITHDYKGAYRVRLSDDLNSIASVRYYHQPDGFPSDLDVNVFQVEGELVFTSEAGIFKFDPAQDRFVPHTAYNALFGAHTRIRRLIPDAQGNIWFVRNDEVGYLKQVGAGLSRSYQMILLPELRGMVVENFEHIYPIDAQNVLIAAKQGFVHFDPTRYHTGGRPFQVQIRAVEALGAAEEPLFGGNSQPAAQMRFTADQRALRFLFAVPGGPSGAAVQYSYYLEGLDKDWSAWTDKPEKDYTNLPHGKLAFHVRARNPQGEITETAHFAFIITTPWYLTLLAKSIYGLLVLASIAGLFWLMRYRHEREKRAMRVRNARELLLREQTFRLEAERTEKELLRLRNERLQHEIAHKNSELASSAMHLVQKGSILTDLKEALKEVASATNEVPVKNEVKRIMRKIDQDIRQDETWEQFAFHFDQVHSDFLKALREAHPQLSSKDLKLCAYLRMNLSTKEIASLMNISVRGTEISRYRLRKKLNLPHETGLTEYLNSFDLSGS